jgi:hypothetical protein
MKSNIRKIILWRKVLMEKLKPFPNKRLIQKLQQLIDKL